MRYILMIAAIAACALSSCGNNETPAATNQTASAPALHDKLDNAGWLLGTWKNVSPDGTAFEVWYKENDTTYAGSNFVLKGKDTIPQETIRLQQSGSDLFYIPTVLEQNGGKAIYFKLTTAAGDSLVFENTQHDFPQRITYTKYGNDSLMASISGNMNGQFRSIVFPMSRDK